jgi:hypothetical protein
LTLALQQKRPRIRLRGNDRALLVWMVRLWPGLLDAVQVVQPETILRWHSASPQLPFWLDCTINTYGSNFRKGQHTRLDAQDWTDGDCGNSSAGALYQGIRGHHQMLNCV